MKLNWRVVFSIAQKDLLDAVKNLYLLFTMILPIGMSVLFKIVIPNEQEIKRVKMVLYAAEPSRYEEMLRAHTDLEIWAAASEQEMIATVDGNREIVGGVIIPQGFDAALEAGQKPEVKVYVNPKATNIQQGILRSIVVDQAWLLVRQEFPVQILWEGAGSGKPSGQGETVQENDSSVFDIERYLLVMLLMMGIAMVGSFVVPSLMVEEKEKHTIETLLVSPGGPAEVALGKAMVGMVYSLLVAGILLGLNNGLAGNWPITLLAIGLGSLFVVGVGLAMGSLFKVMHQVNIWSSIIMLLIIVPSWVEVFSLPKPFMAAIAFIPTSYLSRVVNLSLAGKATLANTWSELTILGGCAVAVFAVILWALRRERK